MVKETVMVFFFLITTPFGIALGITLSKTYKENSPSSLITVRLLNASSAGLLIYMALADLLAAAFLDTQRSRFYDLLNKIPPKGVSDASPSLSHPPGFTPATSEAHANEGEVQGAAPGFGHDAVTSPKVDAKVMDHSQEVNDSFNGEASSSILRVNHNGGSILGVLEDMEYLICSFNLIGIDKLDVATPETFTHSRVCIVTKTLGSQIKHLPDTQILPFETSSNGLQTGPISISYQNSKRQSGRHSTRRENGSGIAKNRPETERT
ncbi:putative zinc transporter 10 [Artemisia annua]|uniref:Putative zinc transporter 10 n=1 Tax=Artemisia annua TaxID=35608 RepID=A0A2U1Q9J3_ARTAN|nr:putative zinc transporter 10 [Artemisia annua]